MRLSALGALALLSHAARSQGEGLASPSQVKAAYLHKIPGYVDWPPAALPAGAPIVVGILGADDVAQELERIAAGRPVQGRLLEVRRLSAAVPLPELQVLFVGHETARPALALAAAARRPILTVTDRPAGQSIGAALNFVLTDGRVRFEAWPQVAEAAGLKLSSRLLAVAERVVTGP